MLLGENGLIAKGKHAADLTEKEEIENKIQMALAAAQIKSLGDNVKLSYFQEELNNEFRDGNAIATNYKENTFIVDIDNKNIEYIIEPNGELKEIIYDKWDGTSSTEPTIISNEIHITKASELRWLANKVNDGTTFDGYMIYLDNNLDLGAREVNGNWDTTENNKVFLWTAIGKSATNMLKATFEGNNHLIKGLYIKTTSNFNGIFGNSNSILNLTLINSYIEGGSCSAGIVGALRSGKIENCHNVNTKVTLIEGSYFMIGGIVGQLKGEVINCTNSGTIIAYGKSSAQNSQCGGIVGGVSTGSILNCNNTGTVNGSGHYIGGIVGITNTLYKINDCYNTGTITGNGDYTGGLANASSTINNCYNTGTVTGSGQYTGGVIGVANTSSTVNNCYNTGIINGGTQYTGGIIGLVEQLVTVSQCYNTGIINGNGNSTGGIAGVTNKSSVVNCCYNTGKVAGTQRTGGIVGDVVDLSEISNCYNTGEINGRSINTGGVAGIIFGIVDSVYNSGTVTGNGEKTGGIVGQVSCLNTDNSIKGTLKNSYNIGTVTDIATKVGGITGVNCGTVENSYTLDTTSTKGVGFIDTSSAIKTEFVIKTQTQMKEQNLITLLGNTNWKLVSDKNNGYPVLNWQ